MSEMERYQARPAEVDSWVEVLAPVGDLAIRIAGTDFVPESMRGKPAAVAAAILTGRELGIGPMTALRHVHVVKGKPGQSAELMRALVQKAGHSVRYVETTDTRCIVEGRRRGEEEWTRVAFTADQARRAKIDLGGYPEDKLVARATSRLCRRLFADVVAGMPYTVDELEDVDESSGAGPSEAPQRTARRRPPAAPSGPENAPAEHSLRAATREESQAAPRATVPDPGLPGEEETVGAEPVEESTSEPEPGGESESEHDPEPITRSQLTKLHAALTELGYRDRDDRRMVVARVVGRAVPSSTELTKTEASTLIDLLEQVSAQPDPVAVLEDLLAATEATEQQQGEQS